jgi:hypothetical protein
MLHADASDEWRMCAMACDEAAAAVERMTAAMSAAMPKA